MLKKFNMMVHDYYAGAIFTAIGVGFILGLLIPEGANIKDYQALAGSILALAAALFAIRAQRIRHDEQLFANVSQKVIRISILAKFLTHGGEWAEDEKAGNEYDEFFQTVNTVALAGISAAGPKLAMDMFMLSNAQALMMSVNNDGHRPSVEAAARLSAWCNVSLATGRFVKYPVNL